MAASGTFEIPKGYEDFVSSSDVLLEQFNNLPTESDQVLYQIYLTSSASTFPQQLSHYVKLRQTILDLISVEAKDYLWHREGLSLQIVLTNYNNTPLNTSSTGHNTKICLQGMTHYGENIEDEWFIVHLLIKISRHLPEVAVKLWDDDGDFLMIEASDYVEDWLGPDNSANRIWIHQGDIHVIPLEAGGKDKSGGMKLNSALQFLRSHPTESRALSSIQQVIAKRTADIFPAKTIALKHNVACIIPLWADKILKTYPWLVSEAVHAFSTTDSSKLSTNISKVNMSIQDIDQNTLVATIIPMTRTLYAQLTFKNFKIPRKYHNLMRRISLANSAKVMNAFNVGCRLLCGLDIVYYQSQKDEKDVQMLREENKGRVVAALQQQQLPENVVQDLLGSEMMIALDDSVDKSLLDILFASFARPSRHVLIDALLSIAASRPGVDEEVNNQQVFQAILKQEIASDSDDWIYLTPEELDSEMEARMKLSTPDDSTTSKEDSSTVKKEEASVMPPSSALNTLPSGSEMNKLQQIVDDFKSFLNQKSDYEGIQVNKSSGKSESRSKTSSNHSVTTNNVKKEEAAAPMITNDMNLNLDYLESVLAMSNLNLDGSMIDASLVSEEKPTTENKDEATESVIVGVARKYLANNTTNKENEEENDSDNVVDSDDESSGSEDDSDDFGSNSDGEEGEDMSEGEEQEEFASESEEDEDNDEDAEEDEEDEEGTEGYSMEDLQRAMDEELFDEQAMSNTFAELFEYMKEQGGAEGMEGVEDSDLDLHFIMNMMQAHAEGLGGPTGPVHQMLSQLGLSLPTPPPMHNKGRTK